MKRKNYKILFICILSIFLILFINTYCFGINMNLPLNNTSSENEIANELYGDDNDVVIEGASEQENIYDEQDNLYENTPTAPSVVTTTTADSNGLTFDNILAIILIAIGIVLILFAIAIFVRFK